MGNARLAVDFADRLAGAIKNGTQHVEPGYLRRVLITAITIAAITGILALFLRLSHVGRTTVVLTLLLAVLGVATKWGLAEAIVSVIAAGVLVKYFVLPTTALPGSGSPQFWFVITTFLATAVTTSQLSLRAKKKEQEAADHRNDLERLYSLGQAILQGEDFESTANISAQEIYRIFRTEAVAFYSLQDDRFLCYGDAGGDTPPDLMRTAAVSGDPMLDPRRQVYVLPVMLRNTIIGSLYLKGGGISETVAQAVAQRVAVALESAVATEETARANAARKSEELRTLVLDTLAHDIKTPLTSIKASVTGLLSETSGIPRSNLDLLSVIDEEVDRLESIVSEAVDMAQIESGLLRLARRPYDVRETLLAALEAMRVSQSGRTVRVDIPESLPQIYIDFRMAKQAFKQLVDNALKYSPDSAPIVVTAEVEKQSVVVRITDSGPGIAPDEQARIFEKFYRGREGQRGVSGTGMGLAIARRIVEQHGGTIQVSSLQGSGAVFSTYLPIYQREEE